MLQIIFLTQLVSAQTCIEFNPHIFLDALKQAKHVTSKPVLTAIRLLVNVNVNINVILHT